MCDFQIVYLGDEVFLKRGSTPIGKNLLPCEEIPSLSI